MPATTYMEVDPRRDHSLRVPRPDLSQKLNTPNACTGCHLEATKLPDSVDRAPLKDYAGWLRVAREGNREVQAEIKRVDQWSAQHVSRWYSAEKRDVPHFAPSLAAGRTSSDDGERRLRDLLKDRKQPAIARATAALELGPYVERDNATVRALEDVLTDLSPQVRAAAIISLMHAGEDRLRANVAPLLNDPIRLVRIEAARSLAHVHELPPKVAERLEEVLVELRESILIYSDRAQAHLVLGSMFEATAQPQGFDENLINAEAAYRTAMRVEPTVTGPRRNLAAVLDRKLEHFKAEAAKAQQQGDLQAVQRVGELAEKVLAEVDRLRREELELLKRDAKLLPRNAAIQSQLGLSLYLHGEQAEAEGALKKACELDPNEPHYAYQLAIYYRDAKRPTEALAWIRKAVELRPDSEAYLQLLRELQSQF